MHRPTLTALRLPLPWDEFDLPNPLATRSTTLLTGEPAWAWSGETPDLGIPDLENPDVGNPAIGIREPGSPAVGKPESGKPDVGKAESGKRTLGAPKGGEPEGRGPEGGEPEGGKSEGGRSGDEEVPVGTAAEGWDLDHVVLLVPDLDDLIATMGDVGLKPSLRMDVRGRPAAFFRVGPLLEVIESPVRGPAIYGVALVTDEQLETVVLRWRAMGRDVGDPQRAVQHNRRIFTVRSVEAGLVVMSPDRAD